MFKDSIIAYEMGTAKPTTNFKEDSTVTMEDRRVSLTPQILNTRIQCTDVARHPQGWSYCRGSKNDTFIYLQGPGKLTNMDIDCDGDQSYKGDGRCGSSEDTQSETAFKDQVKTYGIRDLNASIHPYVVFGNEGDYSPTFHPQKYGVKPLSVMAVVCGGKLVRHGSSRHAELPLTGDRYMAFGVIRMGMTASLSSAKQVFHWRQLALATA